MDTPAAQAEQERLQLQIRCAGALHNRRAARLEAKQPNTRTYSVTIACLHRAAAPRGNSVPAVLFLVAVLLIVR